MANLQLLVANLQLFVVALQLFMATQQLLTGAWRDNPVGQQNVSHGGEPQWAVHGLRSVRTGNTQGDFPSVQPGRKVALIGEKGSGVGSGAGKAPQTSPSGHCVQEAEGLDLSHTTAAQNCDFSHLHIYFYSSAEDGVLVSCPLKMCRVSAMFFHHLRDFRRGHRDRGGDRAVVS